MVRPRPLPPTDSGPTQQLRAHRHSSWPAWWTAPTPSMKGVGRVVNKSGAPPRKRPSTRWKSAVPDDDRPLLSARRVANGNSNRDHARLPPSPTRPSPRHTLPGLELRSRRAVAASFGSLCPAGYPPRRAAYDRAHRAHQDTGPVPIPVTHNDSAPISPRSGQDPSAGLPHWPPQTIRCKPTPRPARLPAGPLSRGNPVNVATSELPGRLRWEHSERPDAAGCW